MATKKNENFEGDGFSREGLEGELRQMPVPGAAAGLEARLLADIPAGQGGQRGWYQGRLVRVAAAAVVIIGVVGLFAWLTVGNGGASIAWADVLAEINTFQPYVCSVTVEAKEAKPTSYTRRVMHWSLTKRREVHPNGVIVVFDLGVPKTLTLVPNKKYAIEKMLDMAPTTNFDLLKLVRSMQGTAEIDELGTRKIEDRRVKGFHRLSKFNDITVWADVQTKLPVHVEIIHVGKGRKIILSKFKFDANFDESLFSVTAPKEYAVKRIEKGGLSELEKFVAETTEADLIEGLRTVATFLGGEFPDEIGLSELRGILEQCIEEKNLSESEAQDRLKAVSEEWTKAYWYTKRLRGEMKVTNFRYAGKSVKLGDANRAILWWCPEGSDTYRVVYGDLGIRNAGPDNLPEQ